MIGKEKCKACAYRAPLKMKGENKKTDLLTSVKNIHIPQFYIDFYNHLR